MTQLFSADERPTHKRTDRSTVAWHAGDDRHHGLRCSPVLTATGLVNGRWQFSTPLENRRPLTDRQNICHRRLRRRLLQLCQIWCTSVHGGLLGEWVKYRPLSIFFIYALFGNSPTGQTRRRIFAHDGANNADLRKDVPFGFCWYWSPFRGKIKKNNFWGVNRRFQAKLVKSNNIHIIKTTASIPTKLCTAIKTTKCP